MKAVLLEVFRWITTFLAAAILALFINNFIIINARIPSQSMEQTIMTGDRLFGFRLAYLFADPKRGDIIIFNDPDIEGRKLIKRIIGMPGDTVDIKDGVVYINGEELIEDYLGSNDGESYGPYEVPEGHYFMMGDNRAHSGDSRMWKNTYLAREDILGKAIFRYWKTPKLIK